MAHFAVYMLAHDEKYFYSQDLTQYNTAHNRQISVVGIQDNQRGRKRKSTSSISFADDEEIINMEDVDPTVGKFRNMVSTTIIPKVSGGVVSSRGGTQQLYAIKHGLHHHHT